MGKTVKELPLVCGARWRGRRHLSPPFSVWHLGSLSRLLTFPWILQQQRANVDSKQLHQTSHKHKICSEFAHFFKSFSTTEQNKE